MKKLLKSIWVWLTGPVYIHDYRNGNRGPVTYLRVGRLEFVEAIGYGIKAGDGILCDEGRFLVLSVRYLDSAHSPFRAHWQAKVERL